MTPLTADDPSVPSSLDSPGHPRPDHTIDRTVALAEDLLTRRSGARVRLADVEDLGGSARSRVVRVRVAENPFSLPRTLVVKHYLDVPDAVGAERTDRVDPFPYEAASCQLFTAMPAQGPRDPDALRERPGAAPARPGGPRALLHPRRQARRGRPQGRRTRPARRHPRPRGPAGGHRRPRGRLRGTAAPLRSAPLARPAGRRRPLGARRDPRPARPPAARRGRPGGGRARPVGGGPARRHPLPRLQPVGGLPGELPAHRGGGPLPGLRVGLLPRRRPDGRVGAAAVPRLGSARRAAHGHDRGDERGVAVGGRRGVAGARRPRRLRPAPPRRDDAVGVGLHPLAAARRRGAGRRDPSRSSSGARRTTPRPCWPATGVACAPTASASATTRRATSRTPSSRRSGPTAATSRCRCSRPSPAARAARGLRVADTRARERSATVTTTKSAAAPSMNQARSCRPEVSARGLRTIPPAVDATMAPR